MNVYKDKINDEYFISFSSETNLHKTINGLILTKRKMLKQYSIFQWQLTERYKKQELFEIAFNENNVIQEINKAIEKIKRKINKKICDDKKIGATEFTVLMIEEEWNELVKDINKIIGV